MQVPIPSPLITSAPPLKSSPKLGLSTDDVETVLKLLGSAPVCGVIAPTGSGKSTTMVEAINATSASIFVVQPTIPAVESLCSYVGKKLGKEKVGSAAEGSVKYTNSFLNALREGVVPKQRTIETPIVYCTAGHMRRVFFDIIKYGLKVGLKDANLSFCDVLMLDESHSRSLDLEVIMALWKFAIEQGAQVPRLLLASATLNMKDTPFPSAPYHEIKVDTYPVTIEYHTKDFHPDARELYVATAQVVIARHKKDTSYLKPSESRGSTWLVFCAGLSEVNMVCDTIRNCKDATITVVPATSNMDSVDLNRIFTPTPKGYRKVIVATNIAETSITIDDLSGVFDTMTEKYGEMSCSKGFRLALHNISKSSARQRQGRTGRTRPGFCYRMCTEGFYLRLDEQRPPEISRVPLHSMIIETLDANLNPLSLLKGILTPVRLQNSIEILYLLNMVTTNPRTSITSVTPIGRFAPKFPVSVRGAAILYKWAQLKKPLFPVVCVVSLIDCFGPSYFFYPRKKEDQSVFEYETAMETHYQTYFAEYDSPSDVETLIKMWLALLDHFKTISIPPHKLAAYAAARSLNNKKLVECLNIIRQVTNVLVKNGHTVSLGLFSVLEVLKVLTPILQDVYSDSIYVRSGKDSKAGTYIDLQTHNVHRVDRRNRLTSEPVEAKEIIALITAEIQNRRDGQPSRYISLSIPTALEKKQIFPNPNLLESTDSPSEIVPISPEIQQTSPNTSTIQGSILMPIVGSLPPTIQQMSLKVPSLLTNYKPSPLPVFVMSPPKSIPSHIPIEYGISEINSRKIGFDFGGSPKQRNSQLPPPSTKTYTEMYS